MATQDDTQIGPLCQTVGCGRVAARRKKTVCWPCYMRERRRGTTDYKTYENPYVSPHGYVRVTVPNHPLRIDKSCKLEYQHRIVFYDAHGAGPFQCHWCGTEVIWSNMVIDHLNDIKTDNNISNLVPSCNYCNINRSTTKRKETHKRTRSPLLTVFGRTQYLADWASDLGITSKALSLRLRHGWSLERACSQALRITKRTPKKLPTEPQKG